MGSWDREDHSQLSITSSFDDLEGQLAELGNNIVEVYWDRDEASKIPAV
jgi:hypothetical protein